MRIRSRAFDYDEMAMSSLLLESTGCYSSIPLPPHVSSFAKDDRVTTAESAVFLYRVIGSVIPKALMYIRPLSKEEIMSQCIDSNAKAFQRYDSNLKDILKDTKSLYDESNRKDLSFEDEYFDEKITSNFMKDHPRMIPIMLKLPSAQEEEVEPIINDVKRLVDSVILGNTTKYHTSKKSQTRIRTVKYEQQDVAEERKVDVSCTSVRSFVQNMMSQMERDLKLEEGSLKGSNDVSISRDTNLQRYLNKKKSQWKMDQFLRQSLCSVAKASRFPWDTILPGGDQGRSKKRIVHNMDFSIRTDPSLPSTSDVLVGKEPKDHRTHPCIVESMNQCKTILLHHLKMTLTTSVPSMTTRRYHKRNRTQVEFSLEPKVKIITTYTETHKTLSPSELMIKYCPMFHIQWHLNETLDDTNIYSDPMDIVPFKFVEDPPLPYQSKFDAINNEKGIQNIPNISISWINNDIIDASKNRVSLVCKRKSRVKRNTTLNDSAETVEKKYRHIFNGLHLVGLNRIVEKYKIDGLFLPFPTKVLTENCTKDATNLSLLSWMDHFFPLETRRRRDIQKFSLREILHKNYDVQSCILDIGSYIQELSLHTIRNNTLDDEMSHIQHLEMLSEHVVNVGELLHLLSKTSELKAFKVNHSTPATVHSPILIDSKQQAKSNLMGKVSVPSFEGVPKENSQLDSKTLKKERKQKKKEERKKRKREKKDERRRKKQKKEKKIDSSAKRKRSDEESSISVRGDEGSSHNVVSTMANDGVTTITVPKLHVGVTPMIVARKTYAVQTTITEEVFLQGDPSSCEANNSCQTLVQNQPSQDQVSENARSTSPMTHLNANTVGLLPNSYERKCPGSTTIETKGAVGITPPSDRKQVPSLQLENDFIDNLHNTKHSTNPSIDMIALDSTEYASKDSTWTNNNIDMSTSVTITTTSFPVLCSETFLEQFSSVAADLSSGRWALCCFDMEEATDHAGSSPSDEMKFTLYDCSIVDICGVDFDLGDGTAIKLFSPPSSESLSAYMKDFMRKMVHITSSGRYRQIHLFFVMDRISSPCYHVNDFGLLQNALIRQPGCNCENIRIHYMNQDILPFNIARIILSSSPSDHHGHSEYQLENEIITRSQFLLGIAPSLSAHECITLISKTISKPFAEVIFSFMERPEENGIKPLARAQMEACCRSSLGGTLY